MSSSLVNFGKKLAETNNMLQKIKKELGGGAFPLAPNKGISHGLEALDFTLDRVTAELWNHVNVQRNRARATSGSDDTGQ